MSSLKLQIETTGGEIVSLTVKKLISIDGVSFTGTLPSSNEQLTDLQQRVKMLELLYSQISETWQQLCEHAVPFVEDCEETIMQGAKHD